MRRHLETLEILSYEQIGDPTIADGILDRLVHNAHRIEMRGESMRKYRNPTPDEETMKPLRTRLAGRALPAIPAAVWRQIPRCFRFGRPDFHQLGHQVLYSRRYVAPSNINRIKANAISKPDCTLKFGNLREIVLTQRHIWLDAAIP